MSAVDQSVRLLQVGQALEAKTLLQQAVKKSPKLADAFQLLGVANMMLNEHKEAERSFNKAIKLQPNHKDAHYNLARLLIDKHQPTRALVAVEKALNLQPNWPQALFLSGLIKATLKMFEESEAAFSNLLAQGVDNAEIRLNLANVQLEQQQYSCAKENYSIALDLDPSLCTAATGLITACGNLGDSKQAIAVIEKALTSHPSAELFGSYAAVMKDQGRSDEVKQACLHSIELNNQYGLPYRLYADAHKFSQQEEASFMLEAAASSMPEQEMKDVYFALGKAFDDCKEYQQAIEYYNEANSIHRKAIKFDIKAEQSRFDMLKKAYSENAVQRMSETELLDTKSIFILGMPRSGTSLVEQIIASHSQVEGAGELSLLRNMWQSQGYTSEARYHMNMAKRSAEERLAYAQAYLDQSAHLRVAGHLLTDKMPHNFMQIGHILTTQPEAKIIHCKRHPIATCLSIYKAYFAGAHSYAYNQQELAHYYNMYLEMMQHWRNVFPGRFYEINYELLTSNQETETRKLIEYCGLAWEESCLHFYKTERKVTTSSAYQVRQKMHNKSVDLWKRYGDGLKPLIDNLCIPEEYQD